ncbi:MAG: sugar phosphate isomerase/epimerase family protein [Planctomycetota bacterium]
MVSMTTDFASAVGCAGPALRLIAEAGFTHVHWCHQWNTDFLYDSAEIAEIARWLDQFGLGLTDLHGSAGVEKSWTSLREYERLAGVELVRNRVGMAAALGADVVIMHPGAEPGDSEEARRHREQLLRSLDTLEPFCRSHGVRLALENGDFELIGSLLAQYGPDFLGLCYDSGHGNLPGGRGKCLEAHRRRLISVHLHDNDGLKDRHWIPFRGTVDWAWLAGVIARSSYDKWVSLEATMNDSETEEAEAFLARAYRAARRVARGIDEVRRREAET